MAEQLIYEKVIHRDNIYYKNKYKWLVNENNQLIGTWSVSNMGGYEYYIFADLLIDLDSDFAIMHTY
jgi:hypothetical protein